MKFMKSWTGPKIQNPNKIVSTAPKAQPMPAMENLKTVAPVGNEMSHFKGTERKLAHFRNLFRQSTDRTGDAD